MCVRATWRATARIAGINLVALGVVLSLSGAGIPAPKVPAQEAIQAHGTTLGKAYAIEAARIQVPGSTDWRYSSPPVGVVAHVLPAYLRRPVTTNPIPPSIDGNKVLEIAAKYVGVPYRLGGTTPSGFDCSGFVKYVYAQVGITLPRSSEDYRYIGKRVRRSDARAGDILVSNGHVAIYAGGSLEIDAPRPGKTIQFREIWQSSYIVVRVL